MEVIKNDMGELWIVKEGFVVPEGDNELNIEEAAQKAYILDVLGSFTTKHTQILADLVSHPESIKCYSDESILSDGKIVYLPRDMEAVQRWSRRFSVNDNVLVMNIIEQVEDIEELKTLLRAIAYMPDYSLLKVGFLEEVTEAIIAQTKKQLRNAEG